MSSGPNENLIINGGNVGEVNTGFTVVARKIVDGELSEANADYVSVTGGQIGVYGDTGGPAVQLGFDADAGISEQLIVNLDAAASSATVSIARLFSNEGDGGEAGQWQAYSNGSLIAQGTVMAPSGHETDLTVDPGEPFDQIIFSALPYGAGEDQAATNDSSDYLISSISVTPSEWGESLLVNGGFEIHGDLNRGSWGTFDEIRGWYTEDTNTDTSGIAELEIQNRQHGGVPNAPDGWAANNSFVELDSHGNGGETHVRISQDFSVSGDGTFELSLTSPIATVEAI